LRSRAACHFVFATKNIVTRFEKVIVSGSGGAVVGEMAGNPLAGAAGAVLNQVAGVIGNEVPQFRVIFRCGAFDLARRLNRDLRNIPRMPELLGSILFSYTMSGRQVHVINVHRACGYRGLIQSKVVESGSNPSSGPRRLVSAPLAVHLLPSEKVARNVAADDRHPLPTARAKEKAIPSPRGEGGSQPALSSAGARRGPHVPLVVGVTGYFLAFSGVSPSASQSPTRSTEIRKI